MMFGPATSKVCRTNYLKVAWKLGVKFKIINLYELSDFQASAGPALLNCMENVLLSFFKDLQNHKN